MSTRSYPSLRRLSACLLTLLLFCDLFSKGARAQTTPPAVTASYATTLTPPAKLGTVYQSALDTFGDLLVVDYANSALYEYPVGGGAVITLVAAGGLGGGYSNPGIAIDSTNNLYIEANYNNCLLKFSYSTTTNSWTGLSTVTPANPTPTICPNSGGTSPYIFAQGDTPNTAPYYFQPWALTADVNNNLIITAQNSGNFVFNEPVVGSGANAVHGSANNLLLVKAVARTSSVAVDKYENVYIVEESDKTPTPGVLMIPAGQTNIALDTTLTRVDPKLPNVSGVATDSAGNLYISDSKLGVFFVPNVNGVPQTSSAVLVTPVAASTQVSIDQARGILYVPTYNAAGSQVIDAVRFNAAELGTAVANIAATTSSSVLFSFNASVTPASFAIEEAGAAAPDFAVATGGSCAGGTVYAAQSNCTVNVSFTPHAAGSVSAKLLMLDASGNTLGSFALHGTGTGGDVQFLPGGEAPLGSGLKTPTQVAVDAGGNVYVADAGLGAVELFPKGASATTAGTAVGTGVKAPTGVAVDGAGDLFIADGGNVYEVPVGGTGLNAAGQVTLKTGLGSGLNLAVDGYGRVYIADPTNHRVVRISNVGGTVGLGAQAEVDFGGFSAPSAVATDQSENFYVADGANLYKLTPTGTQTTVLSSLSAVTGLAVDPTGSVYITTQGKTLRVPLLGGALSYANLTAFATDVTSADSVALDRAANLYVVNAAAGNVQMEAASASYNFGTLTSNTGSAAQTFTLLNTGNAPLDITSFSTQLNYSATATTCVGTPIVANGTCTVTVTFSPSAGQQGTLTASVLAVGDEANAPVGVNGTGVGVALAASKVSATAANPTVDNAPTVVTVTPASGTGPTPTGVVTLTITGGTLTAPATVSGNLAGGTVTIPAPQLAIGKYNFAVQYVGDRNYSGSSTSLTVTTAAGGVSVIQPTMAAVQAALPTYPYILVSGAGAAEPYDGSVTQYMYTYPVKVVTADGAPLIGVPYYNPATGKLEGMNYGSISFQGAPAGSNCVPIAVAADGTASWSTSCLSIDTSNSSIPNFINSYTVTPVYSPVGAVTDAAKYPDVNYTTANGAAITFTALRNPVVQISSNPSSLTVSAGSTTTATLTLTSLLGYGIAGSGSLLNNYSLPLQLQCDGLPAYATCTFTYPKPDPTDPNSVDVGPTAGTVLSYRGAAAAACTAAQGCVGPGTVMMTINTNVPTATVASLHKTRTETAYAAVFGLGLLGLTFGKRRSLRGRLLLLICLLTCGGVMGGISGCSTTQLGTSTGNPSPSGTYSVIVVAKQVGSQAVSGYPPITYGNQNQMSLPFTVNLTVQ